jgi:hypothetical protein
MQFYEILLLTIFYTKKSWTPMNLNIRWKYLKCLLTYVLDNDNMSGGI